jgi:hypothetical protein
MEAVSSGHDDGRYDFSSRGAKVLREFFSPGDGEVPSKQKHQGDTRMVSAID